ncbi:hypothetical protein [Mycolicibacterium sarraceniae]|nr:hypothetical protein [Mycolicibacterium sarraceniae]
MATVDVEDVVGVDLDDCETYGRTVDELVGDDYSATHALADTVQATGTHNLIVFGVRLLHPHLMEPQGVEDVPAGRLTDGARPAAEVAAPVRWFGNPHASAEQWKATGRVVAANLRWRVVAHGLGRVDDRVDTALAHPALAA